MVGTVTKATAGNSTAAVTVKTTETLKGQPFPDEFRVRIQDAPESVRRGRRASRSS